MPPKMTVLKYQLISNDFVWDLIYMSQTYSALILYIVTWNTSEKLSVDVVWLVSADLFAYVNPNHSLRTLEVAIFVKFIGYFFFVLFWFLVFI